MIHNYWLDEAEKEDIAYFRAKMFTPINSKFLNEALELEAKWKKSGLFDGITDKFLRNHTAVLMESQRLCNEMVRE